MHEVFQIDLVEEWNDDVYVFQIDQLARLDIVLKDELVDKLAKISMNIYQMQVDMECVHMMDNESLDDKNIDNHHFVN